MPGVVIKANEFPRYLRSLGARAKAAMQRGIVSGAARCVPLMVKRTDEAEPASDHGATGAVNTGNFRMRWRSRARQDGAEVFNDASYGPTIDKGRRVGRRLPPTAAIRAWARRRLGLSESEAKKAAYPIARAIARRGLRARGVMSAVSAIEQMTRTVRDEVARELKTELSR